MKNIFKNIFFTAIITFALSKIVYAETLHEVHLLDTAQSDCILIKQGNKNYLIDTGALNTGEKVISYLNDKGVKDIEFIIITHYHDDHFGGLLDIIKSKNVKNVLMPLHENENKYSLYEALSENNINVNFIGKGWYYSKDNMTIKAILPEKVDKLIENNNSVVLQADIDGVSYVFMGDAEKEEEKDIKNLELDKCKVLKIGHHGLDTSTSELLLKKLKPEIAIISCDGKESPEEPVLKRIKKQGSKIYRTDEQGDIVIKAEKKDNSLIEVDVKTMIK